jgi:hypothetical protein
MSTPAFVSSAHRRLPLSVALAAAFGVAVSSGSAVQAESAWAPDFRPAQDRIGSDRPFRFRPSSAHAPSKSNPHHPSASHVVQNCDDDGGPDTLRSQIAAAGSGDTIDLSQLACSKITLTQHHALEIHQDDLSLKGPASGASGLTISAAFYSGVVYHTGAGTLSITDLTLSNGIFVGSNNPRGGCIYSAANVSLSRSVVSHCRLQSTQASSPAVGGGIFTQGDLTLASSTITDSAITDAGSGALAQGGGACVFGNLSSNTSTISDNFSFRQAGGVFAAGDVTIRDSTLSGNVASVVGALEVYNPGYTVVISNSTISDNHARNNFGAYYGGIWSNSPVTITSSTIAFNSAQNAFPSEGEGLYLRGANASIQSSIIAGNFNESGPADLGGTSPASLTQDSANNLITSSTLPVPFDTIKDCPKLDVLKDNGGAIKTHGLLAKSPAIDQGVDGGLALDERGKPRTSGVASDIGAFERQPTDTDDRIHVSGFDGLCDR